MTGFAGKRYWLVGASEGLGRALAEALSARGAHLVLSARDTGRLQELASSLPGHAEVLPLDVRDSLACRSAAETLGRIDGIVYLAGLYWPMAAQDWRTDEAVAMVDVNMTGALRTIGAVLPDMVARDEGHIVLTGSLSGYRGLPGAAGYAASKSGLMALAESLYSDLRGSGLRVQLANPGFIRTRLTDKNDFDMPFIMSADAAAERIATHMEGRRFRMDFPFWFSLLFRIARCVPDWLYFRLVAPTR